MGQTLTHAGIVKLKGADKPKLFNVYPTLYVRVMPNGGKTWVQRVVQNGIRVDRGLGSFPFVGIEEAKRKAREQHVGVKLGKPVQTKQEKRTHTFQEVAEDYLNIRQVQWKEHSAEQKARYWLTSMERYIYPKLGNLAIDTIDGKAVEKVLLPIYKTKPAMAGIMRKRVSAVMKRAVSLGYRMNNPVEAIKDYLPKEKTQHFKALDHNQIIEVLEKVKASDRLQSMTKLIVQWIIYTACRPGEARNATWDEIDFEGKTWTIPAEKMKASQEHKIPLSDQAMRVLEIASKSREEGSQLIFTNKRGVMSTGTLSRALNRLGVESVAHGFRSSFRSWAAEQGVSFEIAEAALSHKMRSIVSSYQRSDLLEQRREVMQKWADYLGGKKLAKVVNLH